MIPRQSLFLYGTLRHLPLLEVVLGHAPVVRPARLGGYAAFAVTGESYPGIRVSDSDAAEGLLLTDVSTADRARLDYYEGAYHYALAPVSVETDEGACAAEVYFPTDDQPPPDGPWSLEGWVEAHGDVTVHAAREVMALYGTMTPDEVKSRYPMMLVRATSAVRAAREPAPSNLRGDFTASEVVIEAAHRPYTEYFAVGEQDLRFPLFTGGMSESVRRAAFICGDAVTLLPYDPVRDRVLLIEQFRFGPHLRGDPRPWGLEPIAGRIDPGEEPEVAVRREAEEEARLHVGALHEIARYYPSPGAIAEWLVSYIGIADLPDDAAVIAGEEDEAEDIRGHVISFDQLMDLVGTGEAANGPLLLSTFWLAANRERLRRSA